MLLSAKSRQALFGTGLGDNADDCQAKADAATAGIDSYIFQVGQTWKVTSNYAAADMQSLYTQVTALLAASASAAGSFTTAQGINLLVPAFLVASVAGGSDFQKQAADLATYANAKIADGAKYQTAIDAANASGRTPIVAAPDFKHWVLTSLSTVSSTAAGIAFLNCYSSFAATFIATAAQKIGAIADEVGRIVEAIGDVAATVPETLSFVIKAIGAIAVGMVGLFAYHVYTDVRDARHHSDDE